MTFSKHVGLEPASDLKSRIQTLCREAGFDIAGAQMHLFRKETMQESSRIIHVWIHEPDWKMSVPDVFVGTAWADHTNHQMEIRAIIGADGTFGGTVQVLCMAADVIGDVYVPTLRTGQVPLVDLPPFLVQVAKQQREIIAARKDGKQGPWTFDDMRWEEFNP